MNFQLNEIVKIVDIDECGNAGVFNEKGAQVILIEENIGSDAGTGETITVQLVSGEKISINIFTRLKLKKASRKEQIWYSVFNLLNE